MSFCGDCGNKLNSDEKFCGNCGAKLSKDFVAEVNESKKVTLKRGKKFESTNEKSKTIMNKFFDAESAVNYEQKSLCVLLLDVSFSMEGKRIKSLQAGIEAFHKEIMEDQTSRNRLEIAVLSYGQNVEVLQQPALVDDFKMPELETTGSTSMGKGIDEAIEIVEARKSWYKMTGQPYYRPWIINITDGEPTDIPNIELKGNEIRSNIENKNFFFFNVGVEDASMSTLEKLSSEQMPPAKLDGLKFAEFFQWLSASIQIVAASIDTETESVNLPSPSNWMEGFKIN